MNHETLQLNALHARIENQLARAKLNVAKLESQIKAVEYMLAAQNELPLNVPEPKTPPKTPR